MILECPSRFAISSFLALSTAWYIKRVCLSFKMSALRGQDLVYFVHGAGPSTKNELYTSGHAISACRVNERCVQRVSPVCSLRVMLCVRGVG